MNKDLIQETKKYIKGIFENNADGHDAYHSIRVYELAQKIAAAEHADPITVALAALLHDVDDVKLSPGTFSEKSRAKAFMQSQNLPQGLMDRVLGIIGEVSFAGSDSVTPSSIEGKCVQDADRLDAMGAVGIARAFAFGGSRVRPIYNPDVKPLGKMNGEAYRNHKSTTINHFYEKLLLLKDMMNTAAAREMAEERDLYMRAFLSEFFAEWNGER